MSNYRLLRSQKNEIFDALKLRQINHFDFEVEDTTELFKLTHKETGHFLEITYDVPNWHYGITYSPGNKKWKDQESADSWSQIMAIVSPWTQYLSDEIAQPDYWNDINIESISLTAANTVDNSLFSDIEKAEIKNKLNQIETFIIENYKISAQDRKLISDKLDRLEQKANTDGRLDWLHTAVGVIFTIIVGVGLAPQQAKELAQFVARLLSQIYGGGLPLLP